MEATADMAATIRPNTVTADIIVSDLSDQVALASLSEQLFTSRSLLDYTDVIFINNCGTIQPIMPISTGINLQTLAQSLHVNVTSPMFLTSECLRSLRESSHPPSRAAIVNISSLWATEAAASFGVFGASKAAMEMFYEVLAKETRDSNNINSGGGGCGGCSSTIARLVIFYFLPITFITLIA
jgi:short-subunit dehydrogenase